MGHLYHGYVSHNQRVTLKPHVFHRNPIITMFRCPNRAPTHRHLEVHHVIHLATRITGPKMVDVCDEFVMNILGK